MWMGVQSCTEFAETQEMKHSSHSLLKGLLRNIATTSLLPFCSHSPPRSNFGDASFYARAVPFLFALSNAPVARAQAAALYFGKDLHVHSG